MSTTNTSLLPDYAPVPRSAFGPALNEQGYYVGRVERNLYAVDPPRPRLRLAGAPLMASRPVRDPVGDHLPGPAALVVIDYQPS